MKKLIEVKQTNLVECDNELCDYVVPYEEGDDKYLILFLNKPCPKCGENLLTEADFKQSEKITKVVNWLNKWFSWTTIFMRKNIETKTMSVKVHNGVTIKNKPYEK